MYVVNVNKEPPASCYDCVAARQNGSRVICCFTNNEVTKCVKSRPKDCPLIPVVCTYAYGHLLKI